MSGPMSGQKRHDNQRPHLSSVAIVFGIVLAIEVNGGICYIA